MGRKIRTASEWADIWDNMADRYERNDIYLAAKHARKVAETYRQEVVET